MTTVTPLALAGVYEIVPRRFGDDRGFFSETFNEAELAGAGIALRFVQDNHAWSKASGTLRGLHYQLPPRAQDKLLRVTRGAILDVAVDIRRSSPTFGKWLSLVVSAEKWNQILVPAGFAHGYLTLEPDTEVLYKVTDIYSPEHERSIRFDDPALGIEWGIAPDASQLSDKDRRAPLFAAADLPD
jgi:dTDP-4-dehydrorhamnose 3,5-epimerase